MKANEVRKMTTEEIIKKYHVDPQKREKIEKRQDKAGKRREQYR